MVKRVATSFQGMKKIQQLFFADLIYLKAIVKMSIAAAPCGAILYGSILFAQAAIQGLINISSETKMSKFLEHDPDNSCQFMTFW